MAWTCGACECSLLALRLCGAHLLDDLFHRGVDAVLFEFAFPDGYGRPAHFGERCHGGTVALDVATELCLPKLNIALWLARIALRAAMPKATVDKDGDLAPGKRRRMPCWKNIPMHRNGWTRLPPC